MVCRVSPYEGNEPYIFFSYCHSNEEDVYPIIEAMGEKGYRIWYDDGIHPDEDWPEIIAAHLVKCTVCMAAITKDFAASHNCRNELTTAINNNKTLLPVVLENFQMSVGMSMQLSSCQRIDRREIITEREFYSRLYSAPVLKSCLGNISFLNKTGGTDIEKEKEEMAKRRAEEEEMEKIKQTADLIKKDGKAADESGSASHDEKPAAVSDLQGRIPEAVDKEKTGPRDYDEGETEVEPDEGVTEIEDPSDETVTETGYAGKHPRCAVMVRKSDGKVFEVKLPKTRIGSSAEKCDIVIGSRDEIHAEIIFNNGVFLIVDRDSEDGTFLDGKKSEGMNPQKAGDTAEISFGKEEFVFLNGDDREELEKLIKSTAPAPPAILVSVADRRIYRLSSEKFRIGNGRKKCGIVFDDKSVDYIHAEIAYDGSAFTVRDLGSDTGTFIGRGRLGGITASFLKNKDKVYFGSKKCIFLQGESASATLDSKSLCVLECHETGESTLMLDMPFMLGRHYRWQGGTFSDMHASRSYGSICRDNGAFLFICDKKAPTNGITLCGMEILPGETIPLKDGNEFRFGVRYKVLKCQSKTKTIIIPDYQIIVLLRNLGMAEEARQAYINI